MVSTEAFHALFLLSLDQWIYLQLSHCVVWLQNLHGYYRYKVFVDKWLVHRKLKPQFYHLYSRGGRFDPITER